MRLLFKLLLSAALGFAVVAVLVVVLPTPKTSSSFLATSGFFPEGKVTQLNAEQLRTQFLYANLDAQQSAIAEEHLLSGVLAEYEQFLSELDVGRAGQTAHLGGPDAGAARAHGLQAGTEYGGHW